MLCAIGLSHFSTGYSAEELVLLAPLLLFSACYVACCYISFLRHMPHIIVSVRLVAPAFAQL
ncbi:hypothetical protein EHS86_07905 [Erwinia amylovora]|nr:hypothetical protein AD997_05515 [Erwinia amylovora]RWS38914.1 hypothetical protein EHS86_07905 [Erwinia amylovora]CBJ45753.1 putative membrane protein [Erwinia amylovora ATCC 49946]